MSRRNRYVKPAEFTEDVCKEEQLVSPAPVAGDSSTGESSGVSLEEKMREEGRVVYNHAGPGQPCISPHFPHDIHHVALTVDIDEL
jgi:hypothetical protein